MDCSRDPQPGSSAADTRHQGGGRLSKVMKEESLVCIPGASQEPTRLLDLVKKCNALQCPFLFALKKHCTFLRFLLLFLSSDGIPGQSFTPSTTIEL